MLPGELFGIKFIEELGERVFDDEIPCLALSLPMLMMK